MVDFEGLLKFDIPLFLTDSPRKGDRMTVITKYPKQTKKRNKIFFEKKDRELTNLDWAKWGGWFDTDGCFSTGVKRPRAKRAEIQLKDKQPVELFSKADRLKPAFSQPVVLRAKAPPPTAVLQPPVVLDVKAL